MSRLLHPGLGDYWDRRTILALKIADAHARNVHAGHFQQEIDEIDQHLRSQPAPHPHLVKALTTTNREIWKATDQLLALRVNWPHLIESEVYTVAELGITILNLNEERARLVQELNGGTLEKVRS